MTLENNKNLDLQYFTTTDGREWIMVPWSALKGIVPPGTMYPTDNPNPDDFVAKSPWPEHHSACYAVVPKERASIEVKYVAVTKESALQLLADNNVQPLRGWGFSDCQLANYPKLADLTGINLADSSPFLTKDTTWSYAYRPEVEVRITQEPKYKVGDFVVTTSGSGICPGGELCKVVDTGLRSPSILYLEKVSDPYAEVFGIMSKYVTKFVPEYGKDLELKPITPPEGWEIVPQGEEVKVGAGRSLWHDGTGWYPNTDVQDFETGYAEVSEDGDDCFDLLVIYAYARKVDTAALAAKAAREYFDTTDGMGIEAAFLAGVAWANSQKG